MTISFFVLSHPTASYRSGFSFRTPALRWRSARTHPTPFGTHTKHCTPLFPFTTTGSFPLAICWLIYFFRLHYGFFYTSLSCSPLCATIAFTHSYSSSLFIVISHPSTKVDAAHVRSRCAGRCIKRRITFALHRSRYCFLTIIAHLEHFTPTHLDSHDPRS